MKKYTSFLSAIVIALILSVSANTVRAASAPGDANGDSTINVLDIIALINVVFNNQTAGSNLGADCTADGNVNVLDVICVINLVFSAPTPVTAPATAAPVPTEDAANVIAIYSDSYAGISGVDTPNWGGGQTTVVTAESISGDSLLKFSDLNYQGVDFAANPQDVSAMTHLNIDIWTPDDISTAELKVKLVDFGANGLWGDGAGNPGGDDTEHELTFSASTTPQLVQGAWTTFSIPLSSFTGLASQAHIAQFIVSAANGLSTLYVDNVYFVNKSGTPTPTPTPTAVVAPVVAAPAPTEDAANVIAIYSDSYMGINGVDTPNWGGGQTTVVTTESISGNSFLKFSNLNYQGVDFAANPQDVSAMTHINIDIWTPDDLSAAEFKVKLVDFGANGLWGDGAGNPGGDDSEHELTFSANTMSALAQSAWTTFSIPLSSFTGLSSQTHVAQLIISGTNGLSTLYMDNVYFK